MNKLPLLPRKKRRRQLQTCSVTGKGEKEGGGAFGGGGGVIGRGETKRRTTQNRRRGNTTLASLFLFSAHYLHNNTWTSLLLFPVGVFFFILFDSFVCMPEGGVRRGLLFYCTCSKRIKKEQQCSFFSLASSIAPGANISSVQMTMLRQLLPHPPQSGSHRCNQRCLPPMYVRKYSRSGRKHCVRNNTTHPSPFPHPVVITRRNNNIQYRQ